jgi:hypothetical protein
MSALLPVTHQTAKLAAGRHRGPEDGACVMELASMLAHEPFSDHPKTVCPVIAGFLRSYNNHVRPGRRQDLYVYAARAVGTRADDRTERIRAEMCLRWARETCDSPRLRVRILHRLLRCQGPELDAVYAARAAVATDRADLAHSSALALLDELIAVGADREQLDTAGIGMLRLREPLAAR